MSKRLVFSHGLLLLTAMLIIACTAERPPAATTTTDSAAASSPTVAPATDTPASPSVPSPTHTTAAAPSTTPSLSGDPAKGEALFTSLPCSSCHTVNQPYPGGPICPNLGNVATRAAQVVQATDYQGNATDAASYLRESIIDPNAYLVPGEQYRDEDGHSVMPQNFGAILAEEEIDDLVAFLMQQR